MYSEFKAYIGILLCFLLAGVLLVGGIIYGCVTSNNDYYYEEFEEEIVYPVYYRAVSAQEGHALAINAEGIVVGWGSNADGQLGQVDNGFHRSYVTIGGVYDAVAVFGWRDFSGAIDSNGDVWIWGGNWEGRLALPNSTPTQLTNLKNVKYIWVNNRHFVVLLRNGDAYIRTIDGELEPLDLNIKTLSSGAAYMLFLTHDGEVYGIGDNSAGQLTANLPASVSSPTRLPIENVMAISASSLRAVALTTDGALYQWGQVISFEQLDDGELVEFETIRTPARIELFVYDPPYTDFIALAGGNNFTLAIRAGHREIWGWGLNELGVLGTYDMDSDIPYPSSLAYLHGVAEISASGAYFIMLPGDGTLWMQGQMFGEELAGIRNTPALILENMMIVGENNYEI